MGSTSKPQITMKLKALSNGESRYTDERSARQGLMGSLEDDFEGFTKETFQGGGKDATRKLRDCLRANGVYVPNDRKLTTANLELVLNEYQEWPADDKEGPFKNLLLRLSNPTFLRLSDVCSS